MAPDDVLSPFAESRASRLAAFARTPALLSSASRVVTLPNAPLLSASSAPTAPKARPTAAYVVRPPSAAELEALLSPSACNCRMSPGCDLRLMYRAAGNGEASAMAGWDVAAALAGQVADTTFAGRVVLGVVLDGPDAVRSGRTVEEIAGVTGNRLVTGCVLEPGCRVHGNVELADTHVLSGAAVVGCGSVRCPASTVSGSREGHGLDLLDGTADVEVGPEAGGGRVVGVNVDSTLVDVCHQLDMDGGGTGGIVAPLVSHGAAPGTSGPTVNVLCPGSAILHTPRVEHVYLGPGARIDSAASVASCLLGPGSRVEGGSTVSHALLQWNASISSGSDAHHVFLMERSAVGPHSFTANAIYGPDSHVSGGEVHCTVFGPNANSHHQSLLIGILWPLGRGNVGYGSNVGSNHTGRIPDQETSVGEGTFWGLGSVIKFPVDLTHSPYTIIAAGVQLPPQRIRFPFSLITDGPGGMNQITPGWLLQYSPYTVARSEVKFANRRSAKRHDFYTGWRILRPGVVDMLVDARDRLVAAAKDDGRQSAGDESGTRKSDKKRVFKTDRAVDGLGSNQLVEKGRTIGIRAYTDAVQRYALRGMLERIAAATATDKGASSSIEQALVGLGLGNLMATGASVPSSSTTKAGSSASSKVDWPVLPWNEPGHADDDALWAHQRTTILNELPSIVDDSDGGVALVQLLDRCAALEDDHAERVHKSKSRDDARGAKTVPGYAAVHISAGEDKVVLAARGEADEVRGQVERIKRALVWGGAGRSRL